MLPSAMSIIDAYSMQKAPHKYSMHLDASTNQRFSLARARTPWCFCVLHFALWFQASCIVIRVVLGMDALWPHVSDHCLKDSASCYVSAAKTKHKNHCEKCHVVNDFLVKSVWLCAVCFRNQRLAQQNKYCTGRPCYDKHCEHLSLIQIAASRKKRVPLQHLSAGHESGDFLGDDVGVQPISGSGLGAFASLSTALVPATAAAVLAPINPSPPPTPPPRTQRETTQVVGGLTT